MDAFYYVLLLFYTYTVSFAASLIFQVSFIGLDHLLVSQAHFLSGKSQAEICEHYFAELQYQFNVFLSCVSLESSLR